MGQFLLVSQLIVALLLAFFILIQAKGKGFGRMWGGGSFSRRGLENIVFKGTFVLSFLFIVISILSFAI
jgi:protein translocase SecG subunit